MKYTIEGFNQTALLKHQLDVTDALILRWLVDFAATGKMKKLHEGNKIYFLVKYEGILEALPILGFTTTKSLGLRFDKYCQKGLLTKIVKKVFKGTETLFSIEPSLCNIMYENLDNSQTSQTSSAETEKNEENTPATNPDSSHSKENSGVNKTTIQEISHSKNFSGVKENTIQNPPHSKNFSGVTQEIQGNHTVKKFPVYIENSSIINSSLKNSSATSSDTDKKLDSDTAERAKKVKAEAAFLELSKIINVSVFSPDFRVRVIQSLIQSQIDSSRYLEYLSWAYQKSEDTAKTPDKVPGYFYKSVCENYMQSQFLNRPEAVEQRKAEETKRNLEISCPVCNTKHSRLYDCPVCELKNPANEDEVYYRQNVYLMAESKRNEMNHELENYQLEAFEKTHGNYALIDQGKEEVIKKYLPYINHTIYQKIFHTH